MLLDDSEMNLQKVLRSLKVITILLTFKIFRELLKQITQNELKWDFSFFQLFKNICDNHFQLSFVKNLCVKIKQRKILKFEIHFSP